MRRAAVRAIEAELFQAAAEDAQREALKLPPRKVPRVARRRKREATVEAPCVRLAKEAGWESRKMNGLGFAAWPDRLFLPPRVPAGALRFGRSKRSSYLDASQVQKKRRFWVEFKRPGEPLTPRQEEMRRDLLARGEDAYVCDSRERFEALLAEHS